MVRRDARKGPNWFYIALAIVALVGIGVIAWSMINSKETTLAPLELPADSVADGKALVAMARGVERGPDNAPLQLLVFSDFMCPACAHFATLVEPNLKREYIDTGKLQGGIFRPGRLVSRNAGMGKRDDDIGPFFLDLGYIGLGGFHDVARIDIARQVRRIPGHDLGRQEVDDADLDGARGA